MTATYPGIRSGSIGLRSAFAALVGATLVIAGVTPVEAAEEASDNTRVTYLIEATLEGSITEDELDELIREHRDVAATLPHPDGPILENVVVAELSPSSWPSLTTAATSSTSCKRVSGEYRMRSTLGFTLYRFRHYASFCYDGSRVTSVYNRTYTLTDVDLTVEWQGIINSWTSGVNTSTATSYMQGHARHCVLVYGCYGNSYPWVRLTLRGTGTATYSSGN